MYDQVFNKTYFEKFIKTTEKAAIGAFPFIGKGDKNAADQGLGITEEISNELFSLGVDVISS